MNLLDYIQNIFQIVVNNEEQSIDGAFNEVIYIQFERLNYENQHLEDEHLEAILFERLLMNEDDLKANSIKVKSLPSHFQTTFDNLKETNPIIYLFECYQRLNSINFNNQDYKIRFKNAIQNQATKFLCNIYPTLERRPLLVELFDKHYFEADDQLIKEFLKPLCDDPEIELDSLIDVLKDAYYKEFNERVSKMEFTDPNLFKTISFLKLLNSNSKLIIAFVKLNSPWFQNPQFNFNASDFSSNSFVLKTLVGNLLSISSLPKYNQPNFRYFKEVMGNMPDQIINQEKTIGLQIFKLVSKVHEIFLSMLKRNDCREEVLNYFGLILHCFKNRTHLWVNNTLPSLAQLSDGFMLNFLHVMLLLCKPFSEAYSNKLLKIDARYYAIPALELNEINKNEMEKIHLRELKEDACLVNKPESSSNESNNDSNQQNNQTKHKSIFPIKLLEKNNFNFMTEIFFICHKAIQIGFKSCYDRFLTTSSNLSEISRAHANRNDERLAIQINLLLTKFYSTKTIICQDDFIKIMIEFNMASATWLINMAMYLEYLNNQNDETVDELNITKFYPFNLKVDVNLEEIKLPKILTFVPEFICENIVDSFIHILRFIDNSLLISSINFEPLVSFVLSFIASPHKMKNPHLRAKLAEVLEGLVPRANNNPANRMSPIETDIFKTYERKQYLIPCLIHVYVSIELTGSAVAFEQKFQYRRSIYAVIEYLWNEPEINKRYRQSMIDLSNEAIHFIENPNAPLFLRFINLMSNDAVFVLDEALENMVKLRNLQNEKTHGQWNNLSFGERRDKEHSLYITERMAKWSNMMGKMTITMLYYLTTEIKDIFCHPVFVDRLAAMLNYFLFRLVGPKRNEFKVQSAKEVLFDPALIVLNISRIYVNLGHQQNNKNFFNNFCSAIMNDERSYSSELLPATVKVLWKTKNNEILLIEQLTEVDNKIKRLVKLAKEEEINEDDIPAEFADAILSTLMKEPVKLPSGHYVDKSTIARHLLSDQTDPFSRAPLTMESLSIDMELKSKIEQFIKDYNENRKKKKNNESKISIKDEEMKE